jgi:hypothetical protein
MEGWMDGKTDHIEVKFQGFRIAEVALSLVKEY